MPTWMGSPDRLFYRRGKANANVDGLFRQALLEDAEDERQISVGGCGGITPTDTELSCEH